MTEKLLTGTLSLNTNKQTKYKIGLINKIYRFKQKVSTLLLENSYMGEKGDGKVSHKLHINKEFGKRGQIPIK